MDPPYGVTQETWDVRMTKEQFKSVLNSVLRIQSKADAFTFITFCAAEMISGFLEALHDVKTAPGSIWKVSLTHGVWVKTGAYVAPSGAPLQCATEFLVFGFFTRKKNNMGMVIDSSNLLRGISNYRAEEKRLNFWECPSPSKMMDPHGNVVVNKAQKPVRLLQNLIEHFSQPDDKVLDLCSGTGTTAIACMLTNRNCVSMDKDRYQCLKHRARFISAWNEISNGVNENGLFDMKNSEFISQQR